MWRRLRNTHVLLHVRANGDSPISLAMTHMRWLLGQSGHESTGLHTKWSPMSVGCEPDPSTRAQTRTRANVKLRPRPLCVRPNRLNAKTKQDKTRTMTQATLDYIHTETTQVRFFSCCASQSVDVVYAPPPSGLTCIRLLRCCQDVFCDGTLS